MKILGIGTAVPPESMPQADSAAVAEQRCCDSEAERRFLRRAYESAEIKKRHSALLRYADGHPAYVHLFPPRTGPDDLGPTTGVRMSIYAREAAPLAHLAASRAMEAAHITASELTHVITASCTGFFAPGLDHALITGLGLSPRVHRAHIGFMGCHAALNALNLAQQITRSEPHAKVLVCTVELCTLHFQYGFDPEAVVANALFADGAAALVASASGPDGVLQMTSTGSLLFPDSAAAMTWRIGDHGFRMTLSRRVAEMIRLHLRGWLCEWLGGLGLGIDQVPSWAVHPGGPRIVGAVEQALQLHHHQTIASRGVLAEFGNMSSPTLLFILERLRGADAERPFVALGFGPGLIGECAFFS